MLTDYACACGLVLALCAITVFSLNKVGYAFTAIDGFLLGLLGMAAFTVPMGVSYLVFLVLR